MKKVCSNCKFLNKCNKQPDGTYDGFCSLIDWGNTFKRKDNKPIKAYLSDPGGLFVSPDFGCNMWEKSDG